MVEFDTKRRVRTMLIKEKECIDGGKSTENFGLGFGRKKSF